MKMASTKFLISMNLLGSLTVVSSSSWFSVWLGMELTSLTAPSLIMSLSSSLISKVNSWKYFMIQCYSSSIFLLSVLCMSFSSTQSAYSNGLWLIMFSSMLLKMGVLPFHGWFFHLSSSVPWSIFLILSTIQKIGPLIVISECSSALSETFSTDLMISCVISVLSLGGLVVNFIRYFMVTSSIINSAWMIVSAQLSKLSFISFMLLYFFHLVIVFMFLGKEFSDSLDSTFLSTKKQFFNELIKILSIMSLIGMPPLVGFFMKMSIVEELLNSGQIFSATILTMSSAVIMLMYMKMVISSISNMRIEMFQFKTNPSLAASLLFLVISSLYFIV